MQKHGEDFAGPGKYRGGTGSECCYVLYHSDSMGHTTGSAMGSKVFPSQGLFGGYPPRVIPFVRITGSNLIDMMKANDPDIPRSLREVVSKRAISGMYDFLPCHVAAYPAFKGETLAIGMMGGAGYGDVIERDPELVTKDLREGIVSPWAMENVYYVAYDPQTLEVDYEKTQKMRQSIRQRRLQQGKSYEEFEQEWLKKSPPAEILTYYGSWPDAEKITEMIRI